MAKLSVHGSELLRLEYTSFRLAHMSDGKILRNDGNGWKLYKKLKPGVDPITHAQQVKESRAKTDAACPTWADYRNKLCSWTNLGNRWKLSTAIEMMPDDPDGVWSTACDESYGACELSVEEICELCDLYKRGKPQFDSYVASLRQQRQQSA